MSSAQCIIGFAESKILKVDVPGVSKMYRILNLVCYCNKNKDFYCFSQ